MCRGQSRIDTATLGNGDIRTDRTGPSPGKKKKIDRLCRELTERPGAWLQQPRLEN